MIEVHQGAGPIVLGLPHTGTQVPEDVAATLNPRGAALTDTDWHIHTLYDALLEGVTTVRTLAHRYVIDVNRAPYGASLYPGQNTTGLCPLTDFDGHPIYLPGKEPDAAEIARRREIYHAPYHAALQAEIARVRDQHGVVILYDCHSIRSVIPYLFNGKLSDFNIGTDGGRTCGQAVQNAVENICGAARGYSTVVNGRFKGGWTTRHYGNPAAGMHAIQMELAQSTYMRETAPWTYEAGKADRLRPHLFDILTTLQALVTTGELT